jgi:transcriptional regulator with XRE-family HTH domain
MRRRQAKVGLAALRQERGRTQKEVAERAGWQQESVSRLELKVHDARLSTLRRYVESLGGELRLVAVFGGDQTDLKL